jgi:hypothetical protein
LPLIPANRRIRPGETCRVGDLEVKPLSLSRQSVELEHVPGFLPPRFGGDDALTLRILVKSLSANESFAPMDREHVREPDRGVSESVIETSGESRIRNYPLSRESEWSIVGQSFATLSPGESTEIVLWSEPGCEKRMTERMLWRVPLRTGSTRVEWIGVEFSKADTQ